MAGRWPATLWLVRHGESAANVAYAAAKLAGHGHIGLEGRDVDVPLSPLGERQADALGRWFSSDHEAARPEIILTSPYARARDTARRFVASGGCERCEIVTADERLREKETGILDGLTQPGVTALHPDQAEFRRILGKFYHRPPGGESWCDVILRLRAVLDSISLHHAERRVMIVAHQVVVLCLRYIIENLDEAGILAIDAAGNVANCSITEYRFDASLAGGGGLALARYNETAPIAFSAAPVTSAPDQIVAVRG